MEQKEKKIVELAHLLAEASLLKQIYVINLALFENEELRKVFDEKFNEFYEELTELYYE